MKKYGVLREDENLEYYIRKYQSAISMIQRTNYTPAQGDKAVGFKSALPGEKAKREHILEYAFKIIDLKKRLYELIGRCSPLSPKWPP
tara:strand:+ start:2211 stop:2474 length:264 start_codon:yes stop_codon:yes gene_type:complete